MHLQIRHNCDWIECDEHLLEVQKKSLATVGNEYNPPTSLSVERVRPRSIHSSFIILQTSQSSQSFQSSRSSQSSESFKSFQILLHRRFQYFKYSILGCTGIIGGAVARQRPAQDATARHPLPSVPTGCPNPRPHSPPQDATACRKPIKYR